MMSKYYLVNNKPDDYGNCRKELVETSKENAKQYYYHESVADEHVAVLEEYFEMVTREEEKERTSDDRFYGTE